MVLISVTASAPASATAPATSTMRSVLALNLAHRGRPLGVVGEDRATPFEVGTRKVDLDGDDLCRCRGDDLGGASIVVDRSTPDAGDDCGTGVDEAWQVVPQPVFGAGALQPDGVEHAERRCVHARRWISRPLEG